jgi:hypothetical protein
MAFIVTNAGVDDVLNHWLNKKFVSDLEWSLQFSKFTQDAIIPPGQGGVGTQLSYTGRFIAWAEPPRTTSYSGASTTALTEDYTTEHEIASITTTPTTVTINAYGEYLKIGSMYDYAAVMGTAEKIRKRLRDGALMTVDSLVRAKALTTTTAFYATAAQTGGTTTAPAVTTAMGASTLIGAKKILVTNLTKGFEGVSGHPNGHYAAIITPKAELDIVTEVTTLRVYWNNAVVNVPGVEGVGKWVNGYIGSIYGVATYVTQNYTTATVSETADISYVLAHDGLGALAFRDMNPKIVLNDVNSPYKNLNSVAWYLEYGCALIASARVVKIYSLS